MPIPRSMTALEAPVRRPQSHNGGGAGALLGAAAGDVLVAGPSRLYGFMTQQNVLVSYQLLKLRRLDPDELAGEFLGLAPPEGPQVVRNPEPWFRAWLIEASRGLGHPFPFENAGAAARMIPIGVWFRRDPVALVDGAITAAMVTHSHTGAVVAACALAGAIAAASLGQSGRDFLHGTAEVTRMAEARAGEVPGLDESRKGSPPLSLLLKHAVPLVGSPIREVAEDMSSWTPDEAAVSAVLTAIVAGAPILERPSVVVREVAALEPATATVMTGGIVGARVGLHRWPWHIPNDLWFAELGRRLAARDARIEDLPDPYAVEDVLAAGPPQAPWKPGG